MGQASTWLLLVMLAVPLELGLQSGPQKVLSREDARLPKTLPSRWQGFLFSGKKIRVKKMSIYSVASHKNGIM